MVDVPTAPVLATVPGVQIASVGFWNISNAEDWHPSAEDLAAAVAALDCPAVRRPTLKFGHTGNPGEGDPSIGLVDELRLDDNGQTLVGDFVGVPSWLAAADDQGRSVIASAYPDRSGEFQRDYVCQLGHTHPFVVHAVALLGVMRPGIGTLESLYDLYAKAPMKEEPAMAAISLAGTTIDQVRKAFYDGPGNNYFLWIREMFVDPPELIIQNDGDDSIERMPYTVSGDGDVTFGDSQPVKVEYVNARAAVGKPAVAFASRAEARPDATKIPSAAEAEVHKGKEPIVATLNEGLAELFGIAADADDETILAAAKEALDERAEGDGSAADAVELTVVDAAKVAEKAGLTLVNAATLEALQTQAREGAEARAQQVRESTDRVVSAAIAEGRIAPASREHFMKYMEADREGATAALASLPANLIPVAQTGHGVADEATANSEDDRVMVSLFGKDA